MSLPAHVGEIVGGLWESGQNTTAAVVNLGRFAVNALVRYTAYLHDLSAMLVGNPTQLALERAEMGLIEAVGGQGGEGGEEARMIEDAGAAV